MKLYRNAIILVVVLILLGGTYFFINSKKAPVTDPTETQDTSVITVISVDSEKINLLEFNSENGKFTLKKQDKNWTIEPALELPIDSTVADASAMDVSALYATRVIEESASDLGKYGLSNNTTSLKVGLTDGTFKEIEMGSNNPTNEGVFVKLKGESKVYLIDMYYSDNLKLSKGHFAKKDILPVEPNQLTDLTYEKNGALQYDINISAAGEMKITAPIAEDAEPSKVAPMLSGVVELKIGEVVDENPTDLVKYGLDKPAYTIAYGDGSTTKKILFGKEVKKGATAFAKFPDGKTVFTIDTTPLTFLDVKLSSIINPFVYLPNIGDVSKIELFIDGKTIVSELNTVKDKTDQDSFKVDGKDANMNNEKGSASLFRTFYQAMIGITMDKFEPEAKPQGTPEVSIKYYMKQDSKVVTVDFISKDSNYYYAVKNGVYTNRVFLKSKLDEPEGIRNTYKILKKAIDEAK